MNRALKTALALILMPIACVAETGKECKPVWISGEVDSVDWVGRSFSIRVEGYPGYGGVLYQGIPYPDIPGGIRFKVSRGTQFVQQTQTLGFSYLEQSDDVSVLFCQDSYADPEAIRVVINNAYPK